MTTAFLFASLFAFMLLGMPIAISLGLASVLTILLFEYDRRNSTRFTLFRRYVLAGVGPRNG